MRLTLFQKIVLVTCLPLVCEVAFVMKLGSLLDESERETELQSHVRAEIASAESLLRSRQDLDSCLNLFIRRPEEADISRGDQIFTQMNHDARELERLARSDADRYRSKKMQAIVAETKMFFESTTNPKKRNGDDSIFRAGAPEISQIKNLEKELDGHAQEAIERARATPNREQALRQQARQGVNVLLIANSVLALVLIAVIGKSAAGRLSVLMDNTRRLSEGRALNAPLPGTDEIATLDQAIHTMTQALAEAAKRERAIVEHAVDVILALDAEGRFTKLNPSCAAVWGYQPEELLGLFAFEIVERSQVKDMVDVLKKLVSEESAGEFETRVLRKDGTPVDTLWTAQWSKTDQALFCVAHDITERKQAEERLRESEARTRFIIESMPVGLVVLSNQGYIEHANPTMETIWGFDYDELIGKHVSELLVTEPIEDLSAFTSEFYERTIGHIFEKESRHKSGRTFPAHISLTEFETREGKRLLGILMDVTERHEIERFKREFIGVVSHELRTPLTSIRGSLKLMLTGALGSLSEQANKAITIAERSAGRLINLVNDILDMEKLESGKLEMVLEDTPVAPVLERSLESVRAFADQANVTIELEPTDLVAHADGDRVVQVLVNLMSNAVKYSPKAGTVTVATVDKGKEVELRVIDRGRGIPPTHIDQVFEKFKQVDKTDATQKGGTGLGLTICKLIVEQHGGTIGVESELGKGSTFWFRLPKAVQGKDSPARPLDSVTLV